MILIFSSRLILGMVAMGLSCVLADVVLDALCMDLLSSAHRNSSLHYFLLLPACTKIVSDEQPGWENVIGIDFVACSQCGLEILPLFCF